MASTRMSAPAEKLDDKSKEEALLQRLSAGLPFSDYFKYFQSERVSQEVGVLNLLIISCIRVCRFW